jgi:hypothetical protein
MLSHSVFVTDNGNVAQRGRWWKASSAETVPMGDPCGGGKPGQGRAPFVTLALGDLKRLI